MFLTKEWIAEAFPHDHVLTTQRSGQILTDPRVKAAALEDKQLLHQLHNTYNFDRVVYFSEYLLPHNDPEGELDQLRCVLQEFREQPVEFIYFSGPEGGLTPATSRSMLAQAAENLCLHYAQTSKLQVKVFRTPYIYSISAAGARSFARLFRQIPSGTVAFDEQAGQPVFALCFDELASLVNRVYDIWTPQPEVFTLPEVFSIDHQMLGEALQKLCPSLEVAYGTDMMQAYPTDDKVVRSRYGWFARYSLLDDFPQIYHLWKEAQTPKRSLLRRIAGALHSDGWVLRIVEILLAWGLTELLVRITHTDAQFQMIDYRLAFVMLIGTMYGLNAGVLAAVLASISLIGGYLRLSMTPVFLFYEPANWLPFILYFVVGASCGYVQLRNAETARFVQNENDLLRQRLQFTQTLYQDTLEDKQLFRRQILGRRDSFGKIYTVTQQLNTLQPQEIYHKTVQVMEDILENHSLTIYRMEKGQVFARLTATSAGLQPSPPRSVAVDKYLDVIRAVEQDGIWVNRAFVPDLPMYAAGVRQNGSIIVVIGLRTAAENQMTLYYQNLFRILCGLVETALIRAFEYENAIQKTWYLPGTCLMRTEPFAEQLATACTLQEDKMAQHLLLHVSGDFTEPEAFYAQLERSIRSSDIAGFGPDKEVYLLLNQAAEADLPILTKRMAEKGLQVTAVSLDAQLRLIAAAKKGTANE